MYTRGENDPLCTYNFEHQVVSAIVSSDEWILRIIVVHLNSSLYNRELLEITLYNPITRVCTSVKDALCLSLSLSLFVPLVTIVWRICVYTRVDPCETNGSKPFNYDRFHRPRFEGTRTVRVMGSILLFELILISRLLRLERRVFFHGCLSRWKVNKVYNWVSRFYILRRDDYLIVATINFEKQFGQRLIN